MHENTAAGWTKILRVGGISTALTALALGAAPGCLDRPLEPVNPRTTNTIVEQISNSAVDKIDIVLVLDNSGSMADKQELLREAVPDLVEKLLNPACLNKSDGTFASQPAEPLEACPDEQEREFKPVTDIHIGVITSSLGGHGADSCKGGAPIDDQGHLISRNLTRSTYQDLGFLVWDPKPGDEATHSPQGETSLPALSTDLGEMVSGAGENGCGFEATLEAWYRFLVDPNPYATIVNPGSTDTTTTSLEKVVLEGVDDALLKQRKDFLRPDSLLAIIMLSDENDCSIRDEAQSYVAAQGRVNGNPFHLPPAREECATDPNSECCRSCGQPAMDGCSDNCTANELPAKDDHINLRCFDQKRRFGIDFMWPVDRYATGLSDPQVADRDGNLTANPLFTDLNPDDDNTNIRDKSLVFLAGIVGVPWQDIARKDADGKPNLTTGVNSVTNAATGGFQSGDELVANDTWKAILGDPTCYHTDPSCLPSDPLMRESVKARGGTNPVLSEALVDSSSPLGNSINGHEWTISKDADDPKDDLQYACIFDLAASRDCSANPGNCDCNDPTNDNPLCYDDGGNAFTTTQYRAKAYPGVRELDVLKRMGGQGIVGSICPAQITDNTAPDFGYRPAVGTIVERLKLALGGKCFLRSLSPDETGRVPCVILEARTVAGGSCQAACEGAQGRSFVDQNDPAVAAAKADPLSKNPDGSAIFDCFCEVSQLEGAERETCQTEESDDLDVHGWCYIDTQTVPPVGNPALVEKCPENQKRIIRFTGDVKGAAGTKLFITCSGDSA